MLEAEVYIRGGDTIQIEEKTNDQLKFKISRLIHVVIGRRT